MARRGNTCACCDAICAICTCITEVFKSLTFLWQHKWKVIIAIVVMAWGIYMYTIVTNIAQKLREAPPVAVPTTATTTEEEVDDRTFEPEEELTIDEAATAEATATALAATTKSTMQATTIIASNVTATKAVRSTRKPGVVFPGFTGYCLLPVCNQTNRRLLAHMNMEVNPCDDFYEYVCGNHEKVYPLKSKQKVKTALSLVEDKIDRLMVRRLLEKRNETLEVVEYVKHFYSKCINPRNLIHNKLYQLKDVFNGIWTSRTVNELLSYTLSNALPSLVSMYVAYDVEKKKVLLQIAKPIREYDFSPSIKKDDLEYNAYKNLVELIVDRIILVAPDIGDVQPPNVMTDWIIELELELYKYSREDDKKTKNKQYYDSRSKLKAVDDLKDLLLAETIEGTLNSDLLTVSVDYYIHNYYYLKNLTKYVRSEYALYKFKFYLIWKTVQVYGPILSDEYLEMHRRFLGVRNKLEQEELKDEIPHLAKSCLYFLYDASPLIMGYIYANETKFNWFEKKIATQTFASLRKQILDPSKGLIAVAYSNEDEDLLRKLAARTMSSMQIHIGYPDWIKNEEYLEIEFPLQLDESLNLCQMAIALRKATFQLDLSRLIPHENASFTEWWPVSPAKMIPQYFSSQNIFILPAGVFSDIIYAKRRTTYLNYGSLIPYMARHLVMAMDLYDREITQSRVHYDAKVVNMRNKLTSEVVSVTGSNIEMSPFIKQTIADQGAINVAHLMYSALKSKSDLSYANFGHLNHKAMLFISYASTLCASVRRESSAASELFIGQQNILPPELRVNFVMKNFQPFADAFECELNSKMNPVIKDSVW